MKKHFTFLFISFLSAGSVLAQCPTITCAPTLSLTNCTGGQTIVASSNYTQNITSRWIGPGGIPLYSTGNAISTLYVNSSGTYTVEFKDNLSNCISTAMLSVSDNAGKPTFSIFSPNNYTLGCNPGVNVINISNGSTFPIPGGPISYTFSAGQFPLGGPSGILAPISTYTSNCGNYFVSVKDNTNLCNSSFNLALPCTTIVPNGTLTVSGSNTLCIGTSGTLVANGLTTYTWNTGSTSNTINIVNTNTVYSVVGKDSNGCQTGTTIAVFTDTTCSMVWPGDANNDGLVDNLDVFEIGFAYNNTGAPRTPGGNAYVAQFANNWTGTVSTGKNKSHADCNGDGTINNNDTLAIFNNYSLTHSFKPAGSPTSTADISISFPKSTLIGGTWNVADIILGSATSPQNLIYGVAFDVNFDAAMLEPNSVWVKYTPSFLNASNSNIEFRKAEFLNGKIHLASVRTNYSNVSGNGKIGELYVKVKTGLAENSPVNFSVSNAKRVDFNRIQSTIAGESIQLNISNTVGITENNKLGDHLLMFPNPASNSIELNSKVNGETKFELIDILGRVLISGAFSDSKTIDLSSVENGTYFVRFQNGGTTDTKKLVLQK